MQKEDFIDLVARVQRSTGDAKQSAADMEDWMRRARSRPMGRVRSAARPRPRLVTRDGEPAADDRR